MLSAYPAVFFTEDVGYSVIFPDLNYTATCGDTLDEALAMAVDCLAGYLYTCQRDGDDIPAPSALSDVDPQAVARELDFEFDKAFVNIVTVDVAEYAKAHFDRSVKKTLTIPAWLNDIAVENHVNFSRLLQDALKAHLHLN